MIPIVYGTVRIGGVAVNRVEHWEFAEPQPEDATIQDASYTAPSVYGFGHPLYYDNVIGTLRGEKHAEVDGYEGLRSLEVIIAAYRSARDGVRVQVGVAVEPRVLAHARLGGPWLCGGIEAAGARALPFGLGRQPLAGPPAVLGCVVEGHVDDRMVAALDVVEPLQQGEDAGLAAAGSPDVTRCSPTSTAS